MYLPDNIAGLIRDLLLMKLLAERGGQIVLTWEEIMAVAKEYDTWGAKLHGNGRGIAMSIMSPEEKERLRISSTMTDS